MADLLAILLLEDDADTREPLGELLDIHGYHVTFAGNPDQVRRHIAAQRPDVVVLDMAFPPYPAVTALELIREIKSGGDPLAPTIICFTGYPRLRTAAQEAGCDYFVMKPDITALLHTLEDVVHARAARAKRARFKTSSS